MQLKVHFTISAIISSLLYFLFRSFPLAIASFLSGFLVDLDHCLDYIREYGWNFNANKFFQTFRDTAYKKIIIFMHGWEIVLLLIGISWIFQWNAWILGITVGVFQHLFFDQLFNRHSKFGYFVIWRMVRHFDAQKFMED